MLSAGSIRAQTTTNVPANANLGTFVPTPVIAGDVWNLNGSGIFLTSQIVLPWEATIPGQAVTINGNGQTLTLNDGGGNFGSFFANTGTGTTLNLPTSLTIAGGRKTGGDPVVNGGGGDFLSYGPLVINGAAGQTITLTDNHAVTDAAGTGGTGGAIYAQRLISIATTAGNVVISNNSVLGGPAANDGGFGGAMATFDGVAIGNPNGTVAITGNSASNPVGGGSGGAIWAFNAFGSGSVTITGSTVTLSNNSADGAGGVIAAYEAPVTINGNLTANDNTAGKGGGAIYTANGGNVTVHGSVSMNDNVSTDTTGQSGGAIWGSGNVSLAAVQGEGNVSLTNNRSFGGNGGAVFSQATLTIGNATGTVIMTGNIAAGNGGAAAAVGDAFITGTTVDISDNHIVNSITAGGVGGGVAAGGALTITLTGSTPITANNDNSGADSGGALYAGTGDVTVNGSAVTNNNRSGSFGGAVASQFGNVIVTGSLSADSNTANADGGAIAAVNGSVSVVGAGSEVSLTNNQARNGGAVFVGDAAGTLALGNATGTLTLTGNTASSRGGALYSEGATTLFGTNISNNTAGNAGGAIYSVGPFTLTATTTDTISNNTAVAGTGGAIWAGGDVTLNATGGDVTFSDNTHQYPAFGIPQANAIYLNNTAGAATATLNAAAGRTITFFDPIQSNAANGLVTVTKTGAGTVAFDGSLYTNLLDRWSQVYGNTTVQASTFAVRNNAVYGALAADVGGAAGGSSFMVDSGTTLAGGIAGEVRADNFSLNGILNIAGAALPGSASGGFSTFTVTSNNVVLGGGSQVLFNTYLNDASVQRTDLLTLTLNGSATSGNASVKVANVGGPGALTVGNGIELVQVTNNNGTTAGAFTLAAPVVAGPYDYTLFHGSVDASGPQNWYLRSTLDCSLDPNAAVCAPPTPTPPPPPPAPPHFRVETSLNAALPSIALLYGRNLLDTEHERVGDEEDIRGRRDLHQEGPYTGGWARVIGTGGKQQGDPRGVFGSGPEFSYGFVALQGGQDLIRHEHDDGSRDHAGVTFAVGGVRSDVTHFDGTRGDDKFEAYTLGAYWTHFGAPGWYVDTVLLGTLYDNDRTSANRGLLPFKTKGDGIAGSVEAGYPFKFARGYFIEPQVQLIYQAINFDNAFDNAALVKFSNVDSLIGRIGARFGRTWSLDGKGPDARQITAWIRPNVWQEFRGNPITQFSSEDGFIPFRSDLGGTWGEINLGVNGQLNLNTTLFANASYLSRFDGSGFAYDGKAGVRMNW